MAISLPRRACSTRGECAKTPSPARVARESKRGSRWPLQHRDLVGWGWLSQRLARFSETHQRRLRGVRPGVPLAAGVACKVVVTADAAVLLPARASGRAGAAEAAGSRPAAGGRPSALDLPPGCAAVALDAALEVAASAGHGPG